MSASTTRRILIAGGGIGGLTLALALLRHGFEVEVYEQAPALREIGAGLHVSSNGMLVLAALGVADQVMASAARPHRREIRLWNTGQSWTTFDPGAGATAAYGHPHVTMYRPDLLDVLAQAVQAAAPEAIRLGRTVVGCSQDENGAVLHFADGGHASGDLVVGADGIHSVIRSTLHGADDATFTGLAVWRGVIPAARLPARLADPIAANWIGPGRHVVQYPVRRGELINFGGVVERDDWRSESWTTPGTRADMRADFTGWHADIQTLIDAIEQPFVWALKLRRPLTRWSCGRITLLGDACHPTLPFLAQGAVMAIEDGFVLARALAAHGADVVSALRAYEAARQERTACIIEGSAANTRRFHNPALADPAGAQAYVEREFAEAQLRERFDWIYRYDAGTVPV
ncbi:FAD-dependent monooxygenase [Vineibacter terrae]|uniref:FAD-dependent monooxygenase n=1 Tax=Vineibacter terrae TaxID=2586908 RepID=UPI002E341B7E|nr:FAD-dependent monooxygenase [Vineibacter terrae]HEX2889981.1 FAD-dependent monooxygenase [Vineibacter terrae]